MKKNGAVYFAATGGAAALLASRIKEAEVIAWEDLGTEAVRRLVVEDFPLTVVIDSRGTDLYQTAPQQYRIDQDEK
jgi:fumarate hydratase subunit beta